MNTTTNNNDGNGCFWSQNPLVVSLPGLFYGLGLMVVACFTFVLVGWSGFFVAVFELVGAALMVGVVVKKAKSTTYAVFDYGVYKEQHLPYRLSMLAFSKITKITISYNGLGRLFHFGTVTLHSTGVSCKNLVFTGVKNPETLRRVILAAKENIQ